MYVHIEKLALAKLEGINKAGGTATIYRVESACGLFGSSGGQGGGQESTAMVTMSTFAHHGLTYVPLGVRDLAFDG
jgi:hypothetical protein